VYNAPRLSPQVLSHLLFNGSANKIFSALVVFAHKHLFGKTFSTRVLAPVWQ